jgi:hypothetical protein
MTWREKTAYEQATGQLLLVETQTQSDVFHYQASIQSDSNSFYLLPIFWETSTIAI